MLETFVRKYHDLWSYLRSLRLSKSSAAYVECISSPPPSMRDSSLDQVMELRHRMWANRGGTWPMREKHSRAEAARQVKIHEAAGRVVLQASWVNPAEPCDEDDFKFMGDSTFNDPRHNAARVPGVDDSEPLEIEFTD
jgi:hypothetical protein